MVEVDDYHIPAVENLALHILFKVIMGLGFMVKYGNTFSVNVLTYLHYVLHVATYVVILCVYRIPPFHSD